MPRFSSLDGVIEKYGLPQWVGGYAVKYIRSNPLAFIKKGVSFINYRRKKGTFTRRQVILPNGMKFDTATVSKIASLFLYGEERMVEITRGWGSKDALGAQDTYLRHYLKLAEDYERGVRAINSVIKGLGSRREIEIDENVKAIFDRIKDIDNNYGRIIAIHIIVKYAYARTFGSVFYKVFYPVSPEFMRQIKSVFSYGSDDFVWGEEEARRIIREGLVSQEYVLGLSRDLLKLTCHAANGEVEMAKKAGITLEAELLRDISVAYPFHVLAEAGMEIDPDNEAKSILSAAKAR